MFVKNTLLYINIKNVKKKLSTKKTNAKCHFNCNYSFFFLSVGKWSCCCGVQSEYTDVLAVKEICVALWWIYGLWTGERCSVLRGFVHKNIHTRNIPIFRMFPAAYSWWLTSHMEYSWLYSPSKGKGTTSTILEDIWRSKVECDERSEFQLSLSVVLLSKCVKQLGTWHIFIEPHM